MKKLFLIIIMSLLLLSGQYALAAVISDDLRLVLDSKAPGDEISIIITLNDQVDLDSFKDKRKTIRREKIIKALKKKAKLSQGPVKILLQKQKAKKIRSLWMINGLSVTVKAMVIENLAYHPAVAEIKLDAIVPLAVSPIGVSSITEWNLDSIRAPEVWDLGYRGQGVVVASMDTGVDVSHPDLALRWRGGTNSWYDPNGEHATPYDAVGHGTQATGVMVGGEAGGTAIGVAPEAQWIGVKIFDDADNASNSAIHLGFQWLLDPDGNPATDDSPDIVNNSWGLSDDPDKCITVFEADIQALKAAGIAMVFSAGNNGPQSATSISPANYSESFAVGAIDAGDVIADFSSRGPATCDPTSVFPNIAAPGVGIRTSDLTFGGIVPDSYRNVSGTSFAAPHVAGAMALLLSASPDIPVSELENILQQSAFDLGAFGPDDDYGHGLLDVKEALMLVPGINFCSADLNNDGNVDTADFAIFFANWGRTDCTDSSPCAADLNNDGNVDTADFAIFFADWGRTDCLN